MIFQSEKQIRLRLSDTAVAIIEDDMRSFKEDKKGSFLNTILENYYEDALSSISFQLEKYESTLNDILVEYDTKIRKNILSVLLHAKEEELKTAITKLTSLKKGSPLNPLRLKNNFSEILEQRYYGSQDYHYYKSLAQYLSTVVEEYTHLPYIKREEIFYKPRFNTLQNAIDCKYQILVTKNQFSFYFLPYEIMSNPLSTYSYIVGYSYNKDADKDTMAPCSFRMSTLAESEYKVMKSRKSFLSSERINFLHEEIAQKGVQFLASRDLSEVTVRFTEQGVQQFLRQINLRPAPVKIDGNIYTFHCSQLQASYYFFQFGPNAEILSPQSLRSEFQKKYEEANVLYTKEECF